MFISYILLTVSLQLDLNALNSKVCTMHESFNALCEKMPNTIGNLQSLVDQIDTSMKDLLKNSSETSAELDKAEDFKSFCQAVEDLRLVIICNCFPLMLPS